MKLTRYFFLFLLVSGGVYAQEIEIVGNINQSIRIPTPYQLKSNSVPKSISLLKLQLSNEVQQTLDLRVEKALSERNDVLSHTKLPTQVQLGMNNVPVMDQGSHGTCVTFASTAAIDAVLNKGDYISQLCQLELGRYLENNAYMTSGWDGSWIRTVLVQMELFGMVSKEYQKINGCGGLTDYPMGGTAPVVELTVPEYHQISEAIPQDLINWSSILEPYQVVLEHTDMNQTLYNVKTALNAGDRLTFGILLLDFGQGAVGAVGTHHVQYDTWVLTPEIAADINDQAEFAGHAMVITGYDDHATVTDDQGRVYHGLLTLRNSWGHYAGDKGDFYMTYDYFKALALEIQRIKQLTV
ncbi:C1 family peptidase [bacterium]|nr:C1 family peptidase [bacterium]